MICKYCQKEIPDNSLFCPYCGEKLSAKNNREFLGTILIIIIIIIISLLTGFLIYSTYKSPSKNNRSIPQPIYSIMPTPDYQSNYNNIKVVSPNGNEKLCLGEIYEIKWKVSPGYYHKNVDIFFYEEGKLEDYTIVENLPASLEKYKWEVGKTDIGNIVEKTGNNFKIKIYLEKYDHYFEPDESDHSFSINECK
jgi:predicted nucleic acid-binding Zn ribbon protein